MTPDSIPATLRQIPHWVLWKYEERDGRRTKVLYNAKTGGRAMSNNPATWTDYETAAGVVSGYEGLGFVVTAADGIVGIDMDHCRDPETGGLTARATGIVAAVDSYTEITPSGTGLRIFAFGALPPKGRRSAKLNIEMYQEGRYLTVTGAHLHDTPADLQPRAAQILALHVQTFGGKAVSAPPPLPAGANSGGFMGDDAEILRRMFAASNTPQTTRLYAGVWSDHGSQSEADQALCFHLAFWAQRDALTIDRLFRGSGLFRAKWDERHDAQGLTYGQMTVAHACSLVTETWKPAPHIHVNGGPPEAPEAPLETLEASNDADDPQGAPQATVAPPERIPYDDKTGRILFLIDKTNRQGETITSSVVVADFMAHIVEEITTEEGLGAYRLKGRNVEGRGFSLEVDAKAFADPRQLTAELTQAAGAGCPVRAGTEKHLRPAIQLLSPRERAATRQFHRVGWTQGAAEFLIPGLEAPDTILRLDRKLAYSVAPQDTKTAQTALNALAMAQRTRVTTVAITTALQAPLASLAGWQDERAGLFITGRSGSFKTAWAILLMCLYGPDFQKEDRLFKWGPGATNNSLGSYFAAACDVPLLVDNYKPITGGGPRGMIDLIQMVMEGTEKNRLDRASRQRTARPLRVWPVFTGEDLPDSDAASMARVLVLPFAWEAGAENLSLTQCQNLAGHLCGIGYAWLTWLLSDDGRATARYVGSLFPERRAKWAKFLRQEKTDMVNLFRVASNLATNELTFEAMGGCPMLEPFAYRYAGEHAAGLVEVAKNMAVQTSQAMEANRYLEALRGLLASGRCVLQPTTATVPPDRVKLLGWEDDKGVYLIPDIAYSEAATLLRDMGGLSVTKNTLHKQLVQIKALQTTGTDGPVTQKWAGGGNRRVLHLKAELFNEEASASSKS